MSRQLVTHLTDEMRRAALAHAARLTGRGVDDEEAVAEGARLARLGLLTVDGRRKRRKGKKRAAASKPRG